MALFCYLSYKSWWWPSNQNATNSHSLLCILYVDNVSLLFPYALAKIKKIKKKGKERTRFMRFLKIKNPQTLISVNSVNIKIIFQYWKLCLCLSHKFSSVQFSCSVVSDSLWSHGLHAAHQASLSITNSQSLLKLMSIESVMPSNHLILCHPLLLLLSIFPSIRVFSNESVLHIRWPKYWSFSFSISPSNKYSGLISFRTDWFDLLEVQGTPKSVLQHHSSKA